MTPSTVFLIAAYVIAGACLTLYAVHLHRRRVSVVRQLIALEHVEHVEHVEQAAGQSVPGTP